MRTDRDVIRSEALGCWLVAVGRGAEQRIRIARDAEGRDLFPTELELAEAARVGERAARAGEQAARDALAVESRAREAIEVELRRMRAEQASPRRAARKSPKPR